MLLLNVMIALCLRDLEFPRYDLPDRTLEWSSFLLTHSYAVKIWDVLKLNHFKNECFCDVIIENSIWIRKGETYEIEYIWE
jgi:hypothetical protein